MSDKLTNELLPCPFCGGSNVSTYDGSTFRWLYAGCDECGAQAREVRIQTLGEGTPEEWKAQAQKNAIAAWNERAVLANAQGEAVADEPVFWFRMIGGHPDFSTQNMGAHHWLGWKPLYARPAPSTLPGSLPDEPLEITALRYDTVDQFDVNMLNYIDALRAHLGRK